MVGEPRVLALVPDARPHLEEAERVAVAVAHVLEPGFRQRRHDRQLGGKAGLVRLAPHPGGDRVLRGVVARVGVAGVGKRACQVRVECRRGAEAGRVIDRRLEVECRARLRLVYGAQDEALLGGRRSRGLGRRRSRGRPEHDLDAVVVLAGREAVAVDRPWRDDLRRPQRRVERGELVRQVACRDVPGRHALPVHGQDLERVTAGAAGGLDRPDPEPVALRQILEHGHEPGIRAAARQGRVGLRRQRELRAVEERRDVVRARHRQRGRGSAAAHVRQLVDDPAVRLDRVRVDRLQLGARQRLVDDPVRVAREGARLVHPPKVVDRARALRGRRHEGAREARARLADLERVQHLVPAAGAELPGEVGQVGIPACRSRVSPEARAERLVGQQPLEQLRRPVLVRRLHSRPPSAGRSDAP